MNILKNNLIKYLEDVKFNARLSDNNIEIIREFENNYELIDKFFVKYYGKLLPDCVICGINPGKNGAGKTGIPFIDFATLSKLLPGVENFNVEPTATFFYDIISAFGADNFFNKFYVTNFSSVGYIKNDKNFNYYDGLPDELVKLIEKNFLSEMEIIKPKIIVSLGEDVHNRIKRLFPTDNVKKIRLPHPLYIIRNSNSKNKWKEIYISTLNEVL